MTDDEALHLEREQRELDRLRNMLAGHERSLSLHVRAGRTELTSKHRRRINTLNTRIALQATKVGEMKLKLGVLVP